MFDRIAKFTKHNDITAVYDHLYNLFLEEFGVKLSESILESMCSYYILNIKTLAVCADFHIDCDMLGKLYHNIIIDMSKLPIAVLLVNYRLNSMTLFENIDRRLSVNVFADLTKFGKHMTINKKFNFVMNCNTHLLPYLYSEYKLEKMRKIDINFMMLYIDSLFDLYKVGQIPRELFLRYMGNDDLHDIMGANLYTYIKTDSTFMSTGIACFVIRFAEIIVSGKLIEDYVEEYCIYYHNYLHMAVCTQILLMVPHAYGNYFKTCEKLQSTIFEVAIKNFARRWVTVDDYKFIGLRHDIAAAKFACDNKMFFIQVEGVKFSTVFDQYLAAEILGYGTRAYRPITREKFAQINMYEMNEIESIIETIKNIATTRISIQEPEIVEQSNPPLDS